jgi:hypothetical protein
MILFSPPRPRHRQRNRIVQYVSIGICALIFVSITPVGNSSDGSGGGFLDAPTPVTVESPSPYYDNVIPAVPELPPIELLLTTSTAPPKRKSNKKNGGKVNFITNLFSKLLDKDNNNKRRRNNNNNDVDVENQNVSEGQSIISEIRMDHATPPTATPTTPSFATSIFACSVMALAYMLTTAVSTSTTTSDSTSISSAKINMNDGTSSPMHKLSILLTYLAKAVLMIVFVCLTALWYFLGLNISLSLSHNNNSNMISVTVDTEKILQTLAAHGDKVALLDANGQRILQDFMKVASCDSAKLDLFRHRLEAVNFAVTPNRIKSGGGSEDTTAQQQEQEEPSSSYLPALKIGKVSLEWDLYDSKPCFNIMVEDVHYLVEYTRNTPLVPLLSKSNWYVRACMYVHCCTCDAPRRCWLLPLFLLLRSPFHTVHTIMNTIMYRDELKEQGFPPEEDEDPPIQINSIDMKGHLTLSIRSRPFHTDLIKPIRIELHESHLMSDLFELIGSKSKQAQERGMALVMDRVAAAAANIAADEQQQQLHSQSSQEEDRLHSYDSSSALGGDVGVDFDEALAPAPEEPAVRGLALSEFTSIVENYFKNKALGILAAPHKSVWQFWQQLFFNNHDKNSSNTAIKQP